jgi:hypothetical protein
MSVADIPDIVGRLIAERINSVPEVEAILLLRQHSDREWAASDVARVLYVSDSIAEELLSGLAERGVLARHETAYHYAPETPDMEAAVSALEQAYTHQLIAVTRLIHSKRGAKVRSLARAFPPGKSK